MDHQEKGRAGCNRAASKTSSHPKLRLIHSSPEPVNQQAQPTALQVISYRLNWAHLRMLDAKTPHARRAAQGGLYAAKWDELKEVRGE